MSLQGCTWEAFGVPGVTKSDIYDFKLPNEAPKAPQREPRICKKLVKMKLENLVISERGFGWYSGAFGEGK